MEKGPLVRLGCLLIVCLLLTGCAAQPQTAPAPQVTLPPVALADITLNNDVNQNYNQSVLLYLPSLDGTRLIAVPSTAVFSTARHQAQILCQLLFTHPGTENARPVGGDIEIRLSDTDPVEVSGQVATVNLAASALRLSHEELFTLGQALANTLGQFGQVQYVNVLIAGVQPGLDVAGTLPAGCFQVNTRESLSTLWARASAPISATRRSIAAALYYPAPAGKGILCEARAIAFDEISAHAMAKTLLAALATGAETLTYVPRCPELPAYLVDEPVLKETGGMRRLSLHFNEDLNGALLEAGITRSVMVSAIVCTMTTFLPGLDGVEINIGREKIVSLSPSGTYTGVGETIQFAEGLMQRRHLVPFLLTSCTLYFANDAGKLTPVQRPVPYYSAVNPRALIEQLMLGPQPFDSETGLKGVLPEGLRDADLLGVDFSQGVMRLNFSEKLLSLSQGMDAQEEKRMVYAVVNTLSELPGVKKIGFYIMGSQPETFAGALYLPGEFMPNLNLTEE